MSPRSTAIDRGLAEMLKDLSGPTLAWGAFEERVAQLRAAAARLIGSTVEHVALLPNATLGAYQVAATRNWLGRPEILCSTGEFPSLGQVWLAQAERGARVHWVEPDLIAERVCTATQIVSTPLIAYQDGRRAPLGEIAQAARAAGAALFVDAYQAAGVEQLSVTDLDCDVLDFGTMKYLLGRPGLAFLYVRDPELMPEPQLTGWFGRVESSRFAVEQLVYPSSARKLEIGTPAIPAVYAALAGLELIEQLNPARIRQHIEELSCYAEHSLRAMGQKILSPEVASRGAHLCLGAEDPERLSRWLATRNIIVSPRGSVVRLAFHIFNTRWDVHQLIDALQDHQSHESASRKKSEVLVRL
ncbi:MAG: aminotransferase class V-fold PLP-dependent enzyme [Angustibacter sp.]